MNESTPRPQLPERLAEGLRALVAGAFRVAAHVEFGGIPAEHWKRVKATIAAGDAQLTVQVDVPSAAVRVLVDGKAWAAPECLFSIELRPDPESPKAA